MSRAASRCLVPYTLLPWTLKTGCVLLKPKTKVTQPTKPTNVYGVSSPLYIRPQSLYTEDRDLRCEVVREVSITTTLPSPLRLVCQIDLSEVYVCHPLIKKFDLKKKKKKTHRPQNRRGSIL